MKVIFTQNVKGKGQVGDIKNISDGYALNFLIPNNFAKPATDTALHYENEKKVKVSNQEKKYKKWARQLPLQVFRIKAKADEKGRLFGSVNKDAIVNLLQKY